METEENVTTISNTLYTSVDEEIGSEKMIKNRRIVTKIADGIFQSKSVCPHFHILTGSKSEGFRFKTSDSDYMIVYKNITVVEELDPNYHPLVNETILLMRTDQTRAGFCLLCLISRSHVTDLSASCVMIENDTYVSSLLWREETMWSSCNTCIKDSKIHGPCQSGIMGNTETDFAHSLKCSQWPRQAYPCILRLTKKGWPGMDVLSNIVNNGCHVVPIGDKSSDMENHEWRISFSQAENNLIEEMNHCQFLCYGLLKIFLKEAINTNVDIQGLLCSYFLKTVVLWEIMNNRQTTWLQQDFLKWFWVCFRRLISWVVNGYCPNFFIPENNMFLGKIHGRSKKVLLSHLVSLYRDGYNVFLRCDTLCYKFTTTTTLFDSHFPKAAEDIDLIHEILYDLHSNCDMNGMCKIISYLQHQIGTHPSCLMIGKIFLQYYTQKYLFCAAQMFELTSNRTCNKTMYDRIRKIIRAIKVHGYDLCSHKILSALVFYKFGMDRHVVRSALHIRDCMEERQVITTVQYNLTWQYEVQGGKFTSFNSMMKNYLLCRIDLDKHTYFPDLYEEHKASCCRISYSPMVLVDLMLYLSYNTLSMFRAAESVLLHLKRLINYDLEYHISKYDKAISWEILGVCQEIGSHFHDAYLSYQRALREEKATSFRGATVARIEKITSILNRL